MSYAIRVIADSIGPNGARITTYQLRYPRFIHAEFMTHRAISRNASSSRAVPVGRMIADVAIDPAAPVVWGRNRPGMQAGGELDGPALRVARSRWADAAQAAVCAATEMMEVGTHKQIANRVLEPFSHISVVATATDWSNFFALRCHKDAMPEMQRLAVAMARAYRDSEPRRLDADRWHLPYVAEAERVDCGEDALVLIPLSVARCARVSYPKHDGTEPSPDEDLDLAKRLYEAGHWSPFEHQARARATLPGVPSGNFRGWDQYRQALPASVHRAFDFDILDAFPEDWK